MEDQVQNSVVEQNVGQTTREGLDVSMPDVELASDIPSVQDGVIDEGNRRAPNLITKEGDESEVNFATDWEGETRKFQSMYDKQKADYEKLQGDYKNLQPMSELQQVLESRPDVVEAIRDKLEGKSSQETIREQDDPNTVDESSFDPWEAYYKPESDSYKMRTTQERALVDEAVGKHMSQIQGQVALQNLRNELSSSYDMHDEKDINDFIDFATTPRDQLPIELLIMFIGSITIKEQITFLQTWKQLKQLKAFHGLLEFFKVGNRQEGTNRIPLGIEFCKLGKQGEFPN